ncbi:MAG TPA: alkaline phosphatase D family protein [Actinomycetota bacterium]|nr:alkaline phosphatase D family protein [Actinomycetota bacterium]
MERREFLGRGLAVSAATLGSSLLRLKPAEARAVSVVFSDSFKRKATPRGWGKPWFNQRYGIPWGISKKKGFYDLPAPQAMALEFAPNPVLVLDRDVADSSAVVTMSADNAGARFGLVARAIGYGDYYGAYLGPDGLTISRFTINREDILARAPFAADARKRYLLRLEVSGTSPVSLRAKAWPAGSAEPSRWTADAFDTEADKRIEKPGASGFVFMHDAVREEAARVKVSKFKLESAQAPKETQPTLSFAYAGRVEDGKVRLVAKTDVPAAEVLFHVGTDPKLARRYTAIPADEVLKKQGLAKAWIPAPPPGGTTYWRVATKTKSGDRLRSRVHAVRTPAAGSEVSFGFGSCTHFWPVSRSFEVAAGLNPSFFVHLGDLGYPQDQEGGALAFRSDAFQDRWTRMLGRRTTARLHETSQWIALQDDHDYGADNAYRDDVKPFTVKAFDQISGNLGERHFDVRRGDVHAFFVDVHIDADDPERVGESSRSLLGASQKAWLKDAMRRSDAPLLVVFSSMPMWGLGLGFGSWKEGFAAERRELVDFFLGLQGVQRRVIVCSGNAHAQYVNRHSNPNGGKDLIEFVSSGTDRIDSSEATQVQVHSSDNVVDRSRAKKLIDAFGLVTLQGQGAARKVVLRSVASKTGQNVWEPLELDL